MALATRAYDNVFYLTPDQMGLDFYKFAEETGVPVNKVIYMTMPAAALENELLFRVQPGKIFLLKSLITWSGAAGVQACRLFDSSNNTYSATAVRFSGVMLTSGLAVSPTMTVFTQPIAFLKGVYCYSATDCTANNPYSYHLEGLLVDTENYYAWKAKQGGS